jgi:hypothetical protein
MGSLDVKWIRGSPNCVNNTKPPIQVYRYDENSFILRQSKCVDSEDSFEAPFMYLLFGDDRVMLLDTGGSEFPSTISHWGYCARHYFQLIFWIRIIILTISSIEISYFLMINYFECNSIIIVRPQCPTVKTSFVNFFGSFKVPPQHVKIIRQI